MSDYYLRSKIRKNQLLFDSDIFDVKTTLSTQIKITSSLIKLNDEDEDEEAPPRKIQLLIINGKHYTLIDNHNVYIRTANKKIENIYGINLSNFIDGSLFSGDATKFLDAVGNAWNNRNNYDVISYTPLEYLYKEISDEIGDYESLLYIFLIKEMLTRDIMTNIMFFINHT
jgi:hypothetical protein